ncbi:hypothetical protein [Streptomyces ficellus]|uniref:Secreted protein n=1 Tax=Streptomyces ficellus TaxID=1977088 RepID=A0A6I6F1I7_9ACTN|nr:hypothetical protein [Streptomyces ficellus]QGV77803.1 hypothetical protein EIZ62_05710 [Streptomyces ficellus]
MKIRRTLTAAVMLGASAVVPTAGAAVAASAPASAARIAAVDCDWDIEGREGIRHMHYKAGATFRGGPYSECDGYKQPNQGWAHATCYYYNPARGTKWFWSPDWTSWVYSGNVTFPYGDEPTRRC